MSSQHPPPDVSGAASSSASTSTTAAQDPYAAFYYWDPTANNWAFDYASFYASYGYPADYYAGGNGSTASTAYPGYDASSQYGTYPTASSSSAYASTPASASAAVGGYDANHVPLDHYSGPTDLSITSSSTSLNPKDAKYDEKGRIIPGKLKKGETRTTVLRRAAGKLWEDQTLLEWDPTHKRLFVGDLGGDVDDEVLSSAFARYPSLSKTKVIRKPDGKSKGYGFISFADPEDFLKAWKEMDGKYIGSRPCRLKKAADVVNPVRIGAKKDRVLAVSQKYDKEAYRTKMGGAVGKNLRRAGGVGKPYAK